MISTSDSDGIQLLINTLRITTRPTLNRIFLLFRELKYSFPLKSAHLIKHNSVSHRPSNWEIHYIYLTINQLTQQTMFSKQNLLATVAATVTMFVLGFLIWGIATVSFFEAHSITNVMKPDDEMNMTFIFLGNLFASFGMASLYGKWARGYHGFFEGFGFSRGADLF